MLSYVLDPVPGRAPWQARRHVVVGLFALMAFVIASAFALSEIAVRPMMEGRIAVAVAREFGLTREPSVHVRGAPLVVDVAQEHLSGVDLEISGERFEGLRIERINVHTGRVSFSTHQLMRGSGVARIEGGDGTAVVTQDDLTAYLHSQGLPGDFALGDGVMKASGTVTAGGLDAKVAVTGPLSLDGQTLRFTPTAFDLGPFAAVSGAKELATSAFAFSVRLPTLQGIRAQRIEVGSGRLDVAAVVDTIDLDY
jgi:hypothetical protein